MSRAVIVVDRVAAIVAGLVLIAVGLLTLAWWRGTMGLSGRLSSPGLVRQTTQPWWPWVAGLLGLVLVILGLRWLVAHIPARGVSRFRLPGSGPQGRLTADAKSVAKVAAQVLEGSDGVRSARGAIERERGQIVARLTATIHPHADLHVVAHAADAVSADLRNVLQRDDLHCLVNLRVARRGAETHRVT